MAIGSACEYGSDRSAQMASRRQPQEAGHAIKHHRHGLVLRSLQRLVEAEPLDQDAVRAALIAGLDLKKSRRRGQRRAEEVRVDRSRCLPSPQTGARVQRIDGARAEEAGYRLGLPPSQCAQSKPGQPPVYDVLGVVHLRMAHHVDHRSDGSCERGNGAGVQELLGRLDG